MVGYFKSHALYVEAVEAAKGMGKDLAELQSHITGEDQLPPPGASPTRQQGAGDGDVDGVEVTGGGGGVRGGGGAGGVGGAVAGDGGGYGGDEDGMTSVSLSAGGSGGGGGGEGGATEDVARSSGGGGAGGAGSGGHGGGGGGVGGGGLWGAFSGLAQGAVRLAERAESAIESATATAASELEATAAEVNEDVSFLQHTTNSFELPTSLGSLASRSSKLVSGLASKLEAGAFELLKVGRREEGGVRGAVCTSQTTILT